MPLRHLITDADTLVALSMLYFGTEDRVNDIIDYNNLSYPFISTENADKYAVYAHGYVYVKRDNTKSDVIVKKNWTFSTKPSIISTASKTYIVTEDVRLPAGIADGYIPVRSIVPGLEGNTLEGTVSLLGKEFTKNFVNFSTVVNETPIIGGKAGKVLTTGEYLYIPSEDIDMSLSSTDAGYEQARYYYGEDFRLEDDDIVNSTTGDIATVGFSDNVYQAVVQRLKAERGDNPSDFNWGTDIPSLVGDGEIPIDVLPNRIEIDIYETLSYEDRIHSPEVVSIIIEPQWNTVYIDVDMKIVSLEEILQIRGLKIGGEA